MKKKLADSVKTNLKSFWNYVKTKTSITDLYVDGNNTILTKTNSEKANVLADFLVQSIQLTMTMYNLMCGFSLSRIYAEEYTF